MNGPDFPVAIYSRKSKFTGKGESIGNQIELCKGYIRGNFGEDAQKSAEVFEDEGFSGGDLRRPAFLQMMERIRKGDFRAIVVYRLDRISRNINDFAGLIDELTRLEVSFISIREQFDTGSPMGRAMMFIISVFSQLERETIAQRIRDNMLELAKTGRWLGGNTPTGYGSESISYATVDGKSHRLCRLTPIPAETDVVRQIYRVFQETDSLTDTEAQLLAAGVRSKTGRKYSRYAIKTILQNPVYMVADQTAYHYFLTKCGEVYSPQAAFDGTCGIMAYNRTEQKKGKATVLLPQSQWILAVGQHPGLIPSREWIGVQEALERNKVRAYGKPRRNRALLTGVLWCACGERMYPKLSRHTAPDGSQSFSYVCRGKERSKGMLCAAPNASGGALDGAVMAILGELAEDKACFAEALKNSRREIGAAGAEDTLRLDALRKNRQETERKIAGLMDAMAFLDQPGSRRRMEQRILELSEESDLLQHRIEQLQRQWEGEQQRESSVAQTGKMLGSFRDLIHTLDVEEKRAAVRLLVRQVIWDGGDAHLILQGAQTPKLPHASQSHRGEDSK